MSTRGQSLPKPHSFRILQLCLLLSVHKRWSQPSKAMVHPVMTYIYILFKGLLRLEWQQVPCNM